MKWLTEERVYFLMEILHYFFLFAFTKFVVHSWMTLFLWLLKGLHQFFPSNDSFILLRGKCCLLLFLPYGGMLLQETTADWKQCTFWGKKHVSGIILNLFSSVMLKLQWKFVLFRIDTNSCKKIDLSNWSSRL